MNSEEKYPSMTLRPYQLLCTVCSLSEEGSAPQNEKFIQVLETVKNNPDIPITLRCNVGDVFVYQDPGTEDDTPEGAEYNRKRDLEILLRLNLPPGATLPARILFNLLLDRITTVFGICGYDTVISDVWKGCSKAKSGCYEKAQKHGINAIISPRSEAELQREKKESLQAMYQAKSKKVRPHILVCAICQFGSGVRPPFKPDNLPELVELIRQQPDTLVTLAEGADWMMCAPCPNRAPELNACVNVKGSGGLTNQLRDLRTLQKLGLTYGATMKAKELYNLIFERIENTIEICRLDSPTPSVWWDGCGARTENNDGYKKGREMLLNEFK
ncbi:hypothetical protein FJZ31_33880 [Candidatus Poribacteria bacterium]|nr:hypothetical protein [Candidatus Poribacteria bacterium]